MQQRGMHMQGGMGMQQQQMGGQQLYNHAMGGGNAMAMQGAPGLGKNNLNCTGKHGQSSPVH